MTEYALWNLYTVLKGKSPEFLCQIYNILIKESDQYPFCEALLIKNYPENTWTIYLNKKSVCSGFEFWREFCVFHELIHFFQNIGLLVLSTPTSERVYYKEEVFIDRLALALTTALHGVEIISESNFGRFFKKNVQSVYKSHGEKHNLEMISLLQECPMNNNHVVLTMIKNLQTEYIEMISQL